ncbi:MAG: hypothetical protein ACI9TY_001051 [Alphaproteobacteria bacterium]|jgi:hypothetical protein
MANSSKALINAEITKREKVIRDVKDKYAKSLFFCDTPVLNWFVPEEADSAIYNMRYLERRLKAIKWFIDHYKLDDSNIISQIFDCDEGNDMALNLKNDFATSEHVKHCSNVSMSIYCDSQDWGQTENLDVYAEFAAVALKSAISAEVDNKLGNITMASFF